MEVRNHSYVDEGELINVNGQEYVVGEDDTGYVHILSGETTHVEGEKFFWAYDDDTGVMLDGAGVEKLVEICASR